MFSSVRFCYTKVETKDMDTAAASCLLQFLEVELCEVSV